MQVIGSLHWIDLRLDYRLDVELILMVLKPCYLKLKKRLGKLKG